MLSPPNLFAIISFLEASVVYFVFLLKFFVVLLGKTDYNILTSSWIELKVPDLHFYSLLFIRFLEKMIYDVASLLILHFKNLSQFYLKKGINVNPSNQAYKQGKKKQRKQTQKDFSTLIKSHLSHLRLCEKTF